MRVIVAAAIAISISLGAAPPAKHPVKPAAKSAAAVRSTPYRTWAANRYAATRYRAPVRRWVPQRPVFVYQMQPTLDRYREIQLALAEKGYFSGEANGTWGVDSTESMKKFQADQNIPGEGRLNSLTLIALGLGPRRDNLPADPSARAADTPKAAETPKIDSPRQ